jgi:cytoskeleton protein RodZ
VSLRALEADDHPRLPAPPFVRGFLRAYARHVGLQADEVLLRYEEARRAGDPSRGDDDATGGRRHRVLGPVALTLLVLAALAVLAAMFLGG